jgi:hypothetical protein
LTVPDMMVVRAGALTSCCERVPAPLRTGVYVCRGCGTVYNDAKRAVDAAFGASADVTPMTPRRLRAIGHRLVWVDD